MLEQRVITADRGDAGRRLDVVLQRHLRGVTAASRTRIQQWIENGLVTVNQVTIARAARRVMAGDVLVITFPVTARRAEMLAEALPLDVVYEDAQLLVVNKQAGMVVHPTFRHPHGTLMNALLWHARDWPEGRRPSLVSRLDRFTSGALLVAKSRAMHAALQRSLASPHSRKEYLAVVYGRVRVARGTITERLVRSRTEQRTIVSRDSTSANSRTTFERLRTAAAAPVGLALLRCRLLTGRTHQIRVHLASRGWPIVGDAKYGAPRWTDVNEAALAEALHAFRRQALHAFTLTFEHPALRTSITCEASLPGDFERLLKVCHLR